MIQSKAQSAKETTNAASRIVEVRPQLDTFARIKVVGVGGSGGSALNRMVEAEIRGVEFIAVNTDAQALQQNKAPLKIHIGKVATRGLGAGMSPELGRKAGEETQEELKKHLEGSDMVFITCGLGGGTGTGASPVIADIARRELGALTIAVVTKPFTFEGAQRRAIAEAGFRELAERVDAIITIPNDRLLQIIDKKTTLLEAFAVVDEVLHQGVQGISELITVPGLINLDFADVKAIMQGAGSALMGIGRGSGENRAQIAAKTAIDSPLLEVSIDGAKGILFAVSGSRDLTMHEINEAAQIITKSSDPHAKIIFGAIIDDKLEDEVKITVVATGFAGDEAIFKRPETRERERIIPGFDRIIANPSLEKEEESYREPAFKPVQYNKRAPVLQTQLPVEDDELEIPAFIRKKMQEEG
ncbi:MAG: Cell division protein FtsZ [Parcubacteria group bacterium GW2011_GWC2_44_17]|nr:MAG: Cell division protein FtsZ [Parcubacteria group bacterium GW2011_GWC2_44_17]KKT49294.1 MAG: Cell division protein FtsZ [Parcubacteria group bacterium GW2011_GWF2_44_17]